MTQDAYRDRLLDLAYGELPAREAREVETHAASCEACRAELAKIRGTRRVMAALPQEAAPERGERILLAAAREAAERAAERRRRPLVPRWLLGGAVVAASVLVVGIVSYRVAELSPRRDDRNALMGESPYASAPPAARAAPEAPPAAPGADAARGIAAKRREESPRSAAPESARVAAAPSPPPRQAASPPERHAYASPPPPPARAAAPEPRPSAADLDTPLSPWQRQGETAGERGPAVARAEPEASAEAASPPAASSAPRPMAAAPTRGRASDSVERKMAAAPRAADAAAQPPPEVRTFPGCEGEAVRRIERDRDGRIVRYVREGRVDGRRLRVAQAFDVAGRPAGVTVIDVDAPAAALDARALGLSLATSAEDALDAPPRCGR